MILITHKGSKRNCQIPNNALISVMYADIAEYDQLDTEGRKADAFIHLSWMKTVGAGRNDVDAQLKNIEYTMSAVRLASKLGCKVFLGTGSQAEYGRVEGYLNSKVSTLPENGYGMAKLCAGQMSRLLCEQLGMEHIWTRVLSVYGPYDGENTMVMSAIRKFLAKEDTHFTKGEQKWDYMYSKDIANVMVKLLASGKNGKTYCLGSGIGRQLREYIHDIYVAINGEDVSDEELGIGDVEYSEKQVMFLCADVSELVEDIGELELTEFNKGISEVINCCNKMRG